MEDQAFLRSHYHLSEFFFGGPGPSPGPSPWSQMLSWLALALVSGVPVDESRLTVILPVPIASAGTEHAAHADSGAFALMRESVASSSSRRQLLVRSTIIEEERRLLCRLRGTSYNIGVSERPLYTVHATSSQRTKASANGNHHNLQLLSCLTV